jgi:L-histidine N-alpha-methyltransferase
MSLEEYYPTDSEKEILETYHKDLYDLFCHDTDHFNLIEFGAGDGLKTKILLRHFLEEHGNFRYLPIDISKEALAILCNDLKSEMPDCIVEPLHNDYFAALHDLAEKDYFTRNVILFLGSNIGNFTMEEAVSFLSAIHDNAKKGDILFIGFDLKKNPRKILNAYDDARGITRKFNMNLLERINRELGANFNIDKFSHYPTYDPVTGETKSYIISDVEQEVQITSLGMNVKFEQAEPIYVEVSQKFDMKMIKMLASESGFNYITSFYDSENNFVDSVWEVL